MAIETATPRRKRSKAWIYYAVIAFFGFISGFAHPIGFVAMALAGLYSYYLYRGGRIVVWFW